MRQAAKGPTRPKAQTGDPAATTGLPTHTHTHTHTRTTQQNMTSTVQYCNERAEHRFSIFHGDRTSAAEARTKKNAQSKHGKVRKILGSMFTSDSPDRHRECSGSGPFDIDPFTCDELSATLRTVTLRRGNAQTKTA